MDAAEIAWRTRAAARIAIDRARARIKAPRWNRADLLRALAPADDLAGVRAALADRCWSDAHRELSRHFGGTPQRFVISPAVKEPLVGRIRSDFPDAARDAAARGDRIIAGEYDLLGYRELRFDRLDGAPQARSAASEVRSIDWHFDPVAKRRAPRTFWADVPYLEPSCGDHKVIWELNRHQHWIALGRSYWLTGNATYRDRVIAELASWLDANPPLIGINWASMLELGLRSIAWVWTLNLFADAESASDPPWVVDLFVALDRQLAQIERNLSYYFSPNTHLLGEALALYVCGRSLPQLSASGRREALGRAILITEIDRQIEADGGHAERSTHYHRYTLDFYCLALAVARLTCDDEASDRFEVAVSRLGFAARLLADDRGFMPHIGDDDGGALLPLTGRSTDDLRPSLAVAAALTRRRDLRLGRAPEEAFWMLNGVRGADLDLPVAGIEPMRSSALPETGYYISRSGDGNHLVVDGGPHGYENGGHAHSDALAITLSVRGLPLLIDPGTACYTADAALRDRMRSTALHNTVTIDGRSQSLPRGPFHWAHVANARVRAWRANDGFDFFDGSHDGYAPVEHRRRVFALHGDLVVIADLVAGAGTHAAAAHWHLDPHWSVQTRRSHVVLSRDGDRVGFTSLPGPIECVAADAASGLGWYSPTYGALEPTSALRIHHEGAAPFWLMSVFDLNPENPVIELGPVPVWAEAGTLAAGIAISITRATSIDYVLFAQPDHSAALREAADAGPGSGRTTWRVGEIETDATMLFWRAGGDRPIACLAIVDGSIVRMTGRRSFLLTVPRIASDLHLDCSAGARIAGAAFGARLVVGGKELPIEPDRRRRSPRAKVHYENLTA